MLSGFNMPNKESVVVVRPFKSGDEDGVWNILKEGSYSNINASFGVFLKKTPFLGIGLSLLVVGYAVGVSFPTLLFLACLGLLAVYLLTIASALIYLYGSSLSDIKDIQKYYFQSPDHHFWVAEYEGQIAGTIAIVRKLSHLQGSPDAKQNANSPDYKSVKVAWLRRMAVGKNFRRLGIAKKLVNETIPFCKDKEYSSIFLITTEVHHAARALYSKLGFQLLGRKPYRYMKEMVTVMTYEFEMTL